jgi:GTP-binding protein
VLIDSRHGIKPPDEDMMAMLDEAAVGYRLVLTKADKIKPAELDRVQAETVAAIARRVAAHPEVIVTSSQTGLGVPGLRADLAALARGE